MKAIRSALTLALLVPFGASFAQTSVPAPDFKNKIAFLKDNTLEDLENSELKTEYKNSMTGSASLYLKTPGKESSISHVGAPSEKFVVKIAEDEDPADKVELFQFNKSDKKNRKIQLGAIVMGVTKDVDLPKQSLSFSKSAPGVWVVSPKQQLAPGEYVFIVSRPNVDFMTAVSNSQAMKGYAFSVK